MQVWEEPSLKTQRGHTSVVVLTQACNKGYAKSGTGEEWSKGKVQPMAFLYRSLAKNVFIFLKSCKKEKKKREEKEEEKKRRRIYWKEYTAEIGSDQQSLKYSLPRTSQEKFSLL